jgi:hypothetical protein
LFDQLTPLIIHVQVLARHRENIANDLALDEGALENMVLPVY